MHLNVIRLANALGCSDQQLAEPRRERASQIRCRPPGTEPAELRGEHRLGNVVLARLSKLVATLSTDARGLVDTLVDVVRRDGVLGSIIEHRIRLTAAITVLRPLPTDDVSLATLADDLFGDPHSP